MGQTAVTNFCDLEGKRVCAVQNSAPYRFLERESKCTVNIVRGIEDTDDMFWRYEQFDKGSKESKVNGVTTCEAIVYDWPLLQVGYIKRRSGKSTEIEGR